MAGKVSPVEVVDEAAVVGDVEVAPRVGVVLFNGVGVRGWLR